MGQSKLAGKAMKFLMSLSLFTFLLSFFPLLPSLLPYMDHCTANLSFQLFNYSSERNFMFLFCNGILVFVIKNSVPTGKSPRVSDPTGEETKKDGNFENSVPETAEESATMAGEVSAQIETEKAGETQILVEGLEVENEEDLPEDENLIAEEEEEEEQDEIGLLTADELNKKCEDFIRRMREGIRIESQQFGNAMYLFGKEAGNLNLTHQNANTAMAAMAMSDSSFLSA